MKKRISILTLFVVLCISLCAAFMFACNKDSGNNDNDVTISNSFQLIVDEYKIEKGSSQKILLNYEGDSPITYESEDIQIAAVDIDGTISGISTGITFVSVNVDDISTFCKVSVIESDYAVVLESTNISLVCGSNFEFNAKLTKNGKPYEGTISWTVSSPENCMFVPNENSATFTATTVGDFIVTACSDEAIATCNIKVVYDKATRIATPTLDVKNCDSITWAEPNGANAYLVSVNDGNWIEVNQAEYSVSDLSDELKYGEEITVKVKALAKENYSYVESYIASLTFTHNFLLEDGDVISTCTSSGICKFTCQDCERDYTDYNFTRPHSYVANVCVDCGQERTAVVMYLYDEDRDCYYVAGIKDKNAEIVFVSGTYDDGVHGEKSVTYVRRSAFSNNKGITHMIFPESVTEIQGAAFWTAEDLQYLSMPGVETIAEFYNGIPNEKDFETKEEYNAALLEASTGSNQFSNCINLKTVIIGKSILSQCQAFVHNHKTAVEPKITFYVLERGASNALPGLTDCNYEKKLFIEENGSPRVRYYDANGKCGTWHFADDGYTVIETKQVHHYDEFNICYNCGAENGFGIEYVYDVDRDCYYVAAVENGHIFTPNNNGDVVVNVLSSYDDGVHGRRDVTYLGDSCFKGNTEITHIILPESVTELKGRCCVGMTKLEYFAMPGVSEMVDISTDDLNQFYNTPTIKTLIIKQSLWVKDQAFHLDKYNLSELQIYALEDGGKVTIDGRNIFFKNNIPLIYDDSEPYGCNTWRYAEDGYSICLGHGHNYENEVCSFCGKYEIKAIDYNYDASQDCYYVEGIADASLLEKTGDDIIIRVLDKYNDGVHGEKAVKYVKKHAFYNRNDGWNTNLDNYDPILAEVTHVILPESVTELKGGCFNSMSGLKSVKMLGVSVINTDTNDFYGCVSLEALIIRKTISIPEQTFAAATLPDPLKLQVYAMESGGQVNVNSAKNNLLKDTSIIVYDGSETPASGTWHYDTDGYTVVVVPAHVHVFSNGVCTSCGAYEPNAIEYTYDASQDCYYVEGIADASLLEKTGDDIIIRVLDKYNDGVHGEKAVKYVKHHAFYNRNDTWNTNLDNYDPILAEVTHVILPESVTELKGGCFNSMSGLKSVEMLGVSVINTDTNDFYGCVSLEALIIRKTISIPEQTFAAATLPDPLKLQVYAMESGGQVNVNSAKNNLLKDTSIIVYDGSETPASGTWHYDTDGYTVVVVE